MNKMDHHEVISEDVRWIEIVEFIVHLQDFVSTAINFRFQQKQGTAAVELHTRAIHRSD
jgi:hypothetical protein